MKQCTWNRNVFGIINAEGDPWTPSTFDNIGAAENYLAGQQRQNPTWKLGRHKVVPVSVTVRIIAPKR